MAQETYDVVYTPKLGADEVPYQLMFYFGGFSKRRSDMAIHTFHSKKDYNFSINVPYPPGFQRGKKKFPSDLALMIIATELIHDDDDPHKERHGSQEAGTAAIPLKDMKETTVKLIYHNAQRVYENIDFTKGTVRVKARNPLRREEFLPPNKLTLEHNTNLDSKIPLIAAIVGQASFSKHTKPINPEMMNDIEKIVAMPPWEFHTFVVPGLMLSAGRNSTPHELDWWENLVKFGVTRTNPNVSGDAAAEYLLNNVHEKRDLAAIAVAACAVPANYWHYGTDQTQVKKKQYPCENYNILSRFKLGKVEYTKKSGQKSERYVVPTDDCENDGDDIRMLLRELQTLQALQVDAKKSPLLAKVQSGLQDYLVLQSLTGVHGAKEEDGANSNGEASVGLHSMADVMHRLHFREAHSRINSAKPLFKDWLDDTQFSGTKFNPRLHMPINGEGTGIVDPLGNDPRNNLGPAYGILFSKDAEPLADAKVIMPSNPNNPRQPDKFYVAKVSFVVPELIESGYASSVFTPVTIQGKDDVKRMITQEDFMSCSEKVGLRVEPAITKEQAEIIKHVHSFYPPMGKFQPPEPIESSIVRQKKYNIMNKLQQTAAECGRKPSATSKIVAADAYYAYYQITKPRVESLCKMIRNNKAIIGVKVEEEAVAYCLGGYRVVFDVDTSQPQSS